MKIVSGKMSKISVEKKFISLIFFRFYLPVKMLLLVILFAILKIIFSLVSLVKNRDTGERNIPDKLKYRKTPL